MVDRTVYVITETCFVCGLCKIKCPFGAVEQNEDGYKIKRRLCKGCGVCAQSCPMGAIKLAEKNG